MNFEEINALTFESTYTVLLDRILDTSVVPRGEVNYGLHENETLSFYDRILCHPSLVKPSKELMDAELVAYKQELTEYEQARLDELARVEAIKDRFEALNDVHGAFLQAGFNVRNPAKELERIILEDNNDMLDALESADVDFQDVIEDQKFDEYASKVVDIVNMCVKIVIKHNLKNGLSTSQKDQQKASHADLFGDLNDYRPAKFKVKLAASTPDGVVVTQAMKDELLTYLSANAIN